ncbi:deoxyribodipyrimidine photo-lyase [Oceanihabitans sediminis]|uniref:Deoxyribodipyrimidine photo-lyase n=1 Tax=Oceanihabitans sediminis TaxID=1812012 RepID=A0A368P5J8_9FLAO|nr:deoxyribodipyrimidine photo-lyase [Oceanihabitans sediminis]MDX1277886.1 deoxyribodipyrimidine photo-lyase [Oceanihabitans sediminis]MDX1774501.1 deoxyribodipyrimidine photo-lyase [Oceanihabitans sediminis]RBP27788.1 deoxyribodipyrimidine photo-lyase [Oceanihabitans sediminis]RCU56571.1 deoxyribodipyrimidine photo-lyase [Oceanihabitans sediminis]
MKKPINIFWFRRDLRLEDNTGLFHALQSANPVLAIFIFDSEILENLPKEDARVTFIHERLSSISKELKKNYNSSIAIYHGKPVDVFQKLTKEHKLETVFTNHDYEPYAINRDLEISNFLEKQNIGFKTFKDQVIFEKEEIVKKDGKPYLVYTPYMRTWKEAFKLKPIENYDSESLCKNFLEHKSLPALSLEAIGFKKSNQKIEDYDLSSHLIQNYEATRNFPAKDSTSKLGPHLRFGTVSIRKMMQKAIRETNEIFWQELIWREFFMQILWHFPHTVTNSFKPKYDRIKWRNNEKEFQLWCEGKTGYPLVDAGMRQLNETGFMHNRVRMLVGSFLCKHLLIDWRWGEAYFAEKLHDYEMASNIGNWQWVAGCGVDAAPYFRIFNPTTQIDKFDKKLEYIKKWVPDFQELSYPQPMVDHKEARERCLRVYKEALS